MKSQKIKLFKSGIHNNFDDEIIPQDAAQDSKNWTNREGVIEIVGGREAVGAEGSSGTIYKTHFGYKVDGSVVLFRKTATKVQYFDGSAWQDVITGLTDTQCTFVNYSSLAGAFVYVFNRDGIWKIVTANPGSVIPLFNASVNFKGYSLIDKSRTIMWGLANDPTGFYGSKIDAQRVGTQYTQVSNEVLATGDGVQTVFTGTLAFKAGTPTASCFALALNTNPSSVTATDNFIGVISGTGVTGTINYTTGAYSITFTTPPAGAMQVRMSYQWENSNNGGLTDFTKSAVRLAGEGFVVRQDIGGDAIQRVHVLNDTYYSLKKQSAYALTISTDDLAINNGVFRSDIGVQNMDSSTSIGDGIVFMNTANPDKPYMTILQRNPIGDNIEPFKMFEHFKFEAYLYDNCTIDTWSEYITVACRTKNSLTNDIFLLARKQENTVDITDYAVQSVAKNAGFLYIGSPVSESTYLLFNGFDDMGQPLDNYWTSKGEIFGTDTLKKQRFLRLQGLISQSQYYEVWASYDDDGFQLLGTVRGDQSYVDTTSPQTIGSNPIGEAPIGGETADTLAYPYFVEIKIKQGKFRKRTLRFIAKYVGYVSISMIEDFDLLSFEQRMPAKYRLKQNVSLNGSQTDLPNPQFA